MSIGWTNLQFLDVFQAVAQHIRSLSLGGRSQSDAKLLAGVASIFVAFDC